MVSDAIKLTLLILAAAAVYLIGNQRTQLFDRDEPRYAQCSRQMLQSGDWVVPRLYDSIRAAKGPAIYWCQATCMKVLGDNAGAARLPSAIAMTLVLILTGWAVWKVAGSRRALWTVFVLCSSGLVVFWSAKVCLTDAVLLLCVLSGQICIYLIWKNIHSWLAAIALGIAIGAGGLVKGPFILGVLALAVVALIALTLIRRKSFAALEPPAWERWLVQVLIVVAVIAIVTGPWLFMVHHREPRFLEASREDAMKHLETGAEGHGGPPGWHLLVIWGTYLPWSVLLPLTIISACRHRSDAKIRFALAAVLGSWIFAEIVQTKLPHYMLPAFPALAFLTADAICRCLDGQYGDLHSRIFRAAAVVVALIIVAGAVVPWWMLARVFKFDPKVELIAIAVVGIIFGLLIAGGFIFRRPRLGLISMGLATMTLSALLYGVLFPVEQPLRISTRVAKVLIDSGVVHPHQVEMRGYLEPSLAFCQGGTIREASYPMQPLGKIQPATPWMVITRDLWDESAPEIRSEFQIISSGIEGVNYSDKLRRVEVLVVKRIDATK
jgi:4-amino-4-deoxy-L-arabinose transferase-like glycosyltransferase